MGGRNHLHLSFPPSPGTLLSDPVLKEAVTFVPVKSVPPPRSVIRPSKGRILLYVRSLPSSVGDTVRPSSRFGTIPFDSQEIPVDSSRIATPPQETIRLLTPSSLRLERSSYGVPRLRLRHLRLTAYHPVLIVPLVLAFYNPS